LGVVFQRLGQHAEAAKHWERCLQDDPTDMRARAYLASFKGNVAHAGSTTRATD
jgi:hypothetical protein